MIRIVLVEPEIPQNAGNIMRTCAATGAVLHLIEPLGFKMDEKSIKRSGVNYIDKVKYYIYKDFNTFLDLIEKNIISVSFTTAPIKFGPQLGKNKASCYFRIGKFDLNKLFTLDYVVNYGNNEHY